ncbi:MAG: PLP-dependent aminotransferase family protein [Clostridiaceae bacterium]
MFHNIKLEQGETAYGQIYSYIKEMIENGMLPGSSKLPSTREMATIMKVSRNTIIKVYEMLEDSSLVYTEKGKGTFVSKVDVNKNKEWHINWSGKINEFGKKAEALDIMKHEQLYKRGMISFRSIAPDESLFDVEELKRAFLNRVALEGEKILNYGYARGYKYLIEYLMKYMEEKGVNTKNKEILITNGFTEGFDIVLSSLTSKGDKILCENPTHNTAIKLMRLYGLEIIGLDINENGIDLDSLDEKLNNDIKLAYIIPSYHNPTGMVMPFEGRERLYNKLKEHKIPIVEDGFNEELQYLGTHIAPLAAISGEENSVIYIGSLSKILFPGMRIGWIFADKELIDIFESVKRSKNIHTSFLDQAILYEYMNSGSFEKYVKKVRNIYKEKYELAKSLSETYIPNEYVLGNGGLHIFVKLKDVDARVLLDRCLKRGVIFTPGDIFYTDGGGKNTLRIGFSRNSLEEIKEGIKIIGEEASLIRGR